MAKPKRNAAPQKRQLAGKAIDLENSEWFVPITFGLLALGVIFLFRDFIFSNFMLYGSDMINAGVFHREMFVDYLKETGRVMQWNPYVFGGMPYVEAFHGDIFYPFAFLKFIGSIFRKLGFTQIIHIYLAGLFMYLAARQFGLKKISALLAGVGYMFSPYLVSLVAPGHEGKIYVTAIFPLAMLFADRGFKGEPFKNFTYLGLVIGIVIVSPHPQMSYFMLWSLAIFSVFRLVNLWRDSGSITTAIKPALLVSYAVVIGLCLSAIQFYPGVFYTSNFSPRADHKSGWTWATSWSLHEEDAMSLLIPEFAGVSTREANTFYWGKNAFKDNSEVPGTGVFFLALIGFLFSRRRESWFFGGLAIFALLYALADTTPVFRLFYWLIPKVQNMRAASMIMFIFSFSGCLLAGMGLDNILERRSSKTFDAKNKKQFNYLLFGLPGFLLLLALGFSANGEGLLELWTSFFYSAAATTMVQQNLSKLGVAIMNLPAITSGAWFAFLATAAIATTIWVYLKGRVGSALLLVLLVVVAFNSMRFDSRFISTYDYHKGFSPSALSTFLNAQPGKFRVLDFDRPDEMKLPYHGVEVVVGYHGNQLRWYDDLIGGMGLANVGAKGRAAPSPAVLNLVGMKFMTVRADRRWPENYFGKLPARPVATFGQQQVIQNDNAFPRVFLVDRFRVFDDRLKIYPAIVASEDDLRQVVYLEKAPAISLSPSFADSVTSDSVIHDSVWISSYEPENISIGLNLATNKLLVLTDNYYDAWHATIDGQPAEILRAYGSFRALEIPAGSSEVKFYFESERYATGKYVTLLTTLYLFGIMGMFCVNSVMRRRKKDEKDEVESEEN